MNTRLIDLTETDLRAIVAHEVRAALTAVREENNYQPTKRLTKREAALHLGFKSVRSLDARVKAGVIVAHYDAFGKPYFILGELDGGKMPFALKNRGR